MTIQSSPGNFYARKIPIVFNRLRFNYVSIGVVTTFSRSVCLVTKFPRSDWLGFNSISNSILDSITFSNTLSKLAIYPVGLSSYRFILIQLYLIIASSGKLLKIIR